MDEQQILIFPYPPPTAHRTCTPYRYSLPGTRYQIVVDVTPHFLILSFRKITATTLPHKTSTSSNSTWQLVNIVHHTKYITTVVLPVVHSIIRNQHSVFLYKRMYQRRSITLMNIFTGPALRCSILCFLVCVLEPARSFSFVATNTYNRWIRQGSALIPKSMGPSLCRRHLSTDPTVFIVVVDDDDDDENRPVNESELVVDDDDEEDDTNVNIDPYIQAASSEFSSNTKNNVNASDTSDLVFTNDMSTTLDWGGALGKLRQRFDDIEQGKSGNPSQALFRLMSAQSPNQAIGSFINSANPEVVQAMSGAVSSLLGGLSSPTSGIETIVKATGSKIGTLCFQLQMTG